MPDATGALRPKKMVGITESGQVAAESQNDDPGVFRKSLSSSLELRPSILLRCG